MHIITKEQVANPINTPTGEIISELVGRSEFSGDATQYSIAHVKIPPQKCSPKHHHKKSEESYYMLTGNARIVIDGEEETLSSGQTCLIKPNQVHQIFNNGTTDVEFLAISAPAWVPGDTFSNS